MGGGACNKCPGRATHACFAAERGWLIARPRQARHRGVAHLQRNNAPARCAQQGVAHEEGAGTWFSASVKPTLPKSMTWSGWSAIMRSAGVATGRRAEARRAVACAAEALRSAGATGPCTEKAAAERIAAEIDRSSTERIILRTRDAKCKHAPCGHKVSLLPDPAAGSAPHKSPRRRSPAQRTTLLLWSTLVL